MNTSHYPSPRILSRLATCAAALTLALHAPSIWAAEPTLQVKDNDTWVMAGDSITAQRMHTNFVEAYYRTRHPQWHLHFRNSGIGGNRVGSILARFDYDVAAWKPTIVSIELGMNDVNGGGTEETYLKGMKDLIAKIRAIPAQPVLISSSPVDDGSILNDWKSERCQKLHPFTDALKKLAAEENVVFVDQYHPLLDLWGQNRRKGEELARRNGTWPPKATPAPATPVPAAASVGGKPTPSVRLDAAPRVAQSAEAPAGGKPTPPARPPAPPIAPSLIPLTGDTVHPGAVGQFTMAATILAGLKADGDVSSATIKADGKIVDAKRCKITDVKAKDGKLSFTRLDECNPWPILPTARKTVELLPDMLKLSQYVLKVQGLADGDYRVSIEGKPAGTVSAKDLAAGWNMTTAFDSVIGERAANILTLINKLQTPLNNDWRAASKAKDAEKLAAAQKAIDAAEAEIQTALQPVPLHFVIEK